MVEQTPVWLSDTCYPVAQLRRSNNICSEGVGGSFPYNPSSDGTNLSSFYTGSLAVTTGGSGMDLSVLAGEAWIKGDDDAPDQGFYWVENDATITGAPNLTVTAASASDPRIDIVVATVRDSDYSGSDKDWYAHIVAGTPTAGANLTNRNGAAAVPSDSILLAYVLVPALFAGPFVNATHIKDARKPYGECSAGLPRLTFSIDPSGSPFNFVKANFPWLKSVRVRATGGGGGGGGGNGGVASGAAKGSGGGGGGCAEAIIDADRLAATEVCTAGAGGTAGSSSGGNGGNGANSTFGAWLTGNGGSGGNGMTPATTGNNGTAGGNGGFASVAGSILGFIAEGGDGQDGYVNAGFGNRPNGGPAGGAGGGGGRGGDGGAAASDGGFPGGGGGGGGSSTGNAGQTGAPGGDGAIVLELFG